MPLKTSASEELPSVNLTPMIDVVFLLIIFFMVGTQFTQSEKQVALQLPGVGDLKAMVAAQDRREVSITAAGDILFDSRQVSADELAQTLSNLRQHFPDLRVAIRADGEVRYQTVASVLWAVNKAGVTDLTTALRTDTSLLR